jgi:membrane protease YdiL (CAAX protease family)
MSRLRMTIANHPVASYVVIAFALSWILTYALSVSIVFGLLALFGPAVAAIIVTKADGTWPQLRARITSWRQPLRWYGVALAIPFGVAAVGRAFYVLTGGSAIGFGTISAIEILIFVLVIGEEIGWRGFLQPRLRSRMDLLWAGLATGIVWTLWHLPIYLSPEQGLSKFLTFGWWVVPLAVVMGLVGERVRYSVLIATVMHGAANIATPILLPDVNAQWTHVVTGTAYALLVAAIVGWSWLRKRSSRADLAGVASTLA